ncbi:hypothetical protein A3A66_03265 [Microgenomates group bacterium RIFCSPLOWO2_01_FULL_46_13]|nr:MAG: hypothetical protein A2783_04440 [Microgenomates group bacterium RIFCSPHIGHO2_01_FULL_45_11]OGV95012.1 MAG: hypothetical protein A3A66_03265 [Microgenomates group bacterium RIFCSPLOWO2_01_FULL_46_13]
MDTMVSRLNRIEGQIKGIQKMYADSRDCLDIVQQVIAVRQALGRVGKDLLTSEAVKCARTNRQKTLDRLLKNLFNVI